MARFIRYIMLKVGTPFSIKFYLMNPKLLLNLETLIHALLTSKMTPRVRVYNAMHDIIGISC